MEQARILRRYAVIMLAVCMLLTGCGAVQNAAGEEQSAEAVQAVTVPAETLSTEPTETEPPETKPKRTVEELSVAVYPYIPNVDLFERLLIEKWAELEPDVALNLERWECYNGPNDCDVLMYDAVVLSYLVENGYIQPIAPEEMENVEGIIPFSLDGTFHKGRYYGMPFFLCGEFLIYYKSDTEMENVENLVKLASVAEERQKKNPNTGVVVYDNDSAVYHYLDASIDMREEYSLYEQAPDCSNLDQKVLRYINTLPSIAMDLPQEKLETMSEKELFSRGYGFAYFGYTEDMSSMGNALDKMAIKKLSFTENVNIPLFYLDVISVASHVTDPEKLELCKELMNLVASEDFLKELCFANGDPQYLLPARESVYLAAEEEYPMYSQLHAIAMDPCNRAFRFGVDFYQYRDAFRKAT